MLITVVVPCYNEEESLTAFHERLTAIVTTIDAEFNILYIDDGSKDRTLDILRAFSNADDMVHYLSLARNFGHQIALTAGLDHAIGDAVISLDADLQHPPESIPKMVEAYQKGFDVVYVARETEEFRGILKIMTARIFYSLMQRSMPVPIIPGAADYRLISARVLDQVRTMRERHRFLRGMIPWLGYPYAVITYKPEDRYAGVSKYTWRKMFRFARDGLFSFSTIPLSIITMAGLVVGAIAILYLVYIVVLTLFIPDIEPVRGWSSTTAAILILGSVQLISIGIIAEYLGMIFEEVKERPLYTLKENQSQRQE